MTKKAQEELLENFKQKRIKAFFIILGVTVSVILLSILIGYVIDTVFHTEYYGIIIALIVSFPLVQLILFKTLKGLCKKSPSSQK